MRKAVPTEKEIVTSECRLMVNLGVTRDVARSGPKHSTRRSYLDGTASKNRITSSASTKLVRSENIVLLGGK